MATWHLTKLVGVPMVAQGRGQRHQRGLHLRPGGLPPIKQADYAASKGGVVNLTREMAVQWARKGVRVNALAPGLVRQRDDRADAGGVLAAVHHPNCPMARMGAEDELDGALLLLASDAGGYMTGHVLTVDGGWTAR